MVDSVTMKERDLDELFERAVVIACAIAAAWFMGRSWFESAMGVSNGGWWGQ